MLGPRRETRACQRKKRGGRVLEVRAGSFWLAGGWSAPRWRWRSTPQTNASWALLWSWGRRTSLHQEQLLEWMCLALGGAHLGPTPSTMSLYTQEDVREITRISYSVVNVCCGTERAAHLLPWGTRGPHGYWCPFMLCLQQIQRKLQVAKPTGTRRTWSRILWTTSCRCVDHMRLEKEVINSEHREASRPASSPAEDYGASGMELLQCGEERCWGAGGTLSDVLEGKSLRGKKSHLGPNPWLCLWGCSVSAGSSKWTSYLAVSQLLFTWDFYHDF